MSAAPKLSQSNLRTLFLGGIVFLAAPMVLEAQVGLSSGPAQVALVAHSDPRGSVHAVSPLRETARSGNVRQASVQLSLSANTGYRVVVRAAGASSSRIWVRAANGEFQELSAGKSVTVARDTHCAGQWEREVQYRIEAKESGAEMNALPVRYDIVIDPVI